MLPPLLLCCYACKACQCKLTALLQSVRMSGDLAYSECFTAILVLAIMYACTLQLS